jgi:hypothetical protein
VDQQKSSPVLSTHREGDLIFVTKAEIAVIKRAIGHRAILDEGLYKTYINFQSLFDLF